MPRLSMRLQDASKCLSKEKNDKFDKKNIAKHLRIKKIVVPLHPQSRNNDSKDMMKEWFLG